MICRNSYVKIKFFNDIYQKLDKSFNHTHTHTHTHTRARAHTVPLKSIRSPVENIR